LNKYAHVVRKQSAHDIWPASKWGNIKRIQGVIWFILCSDWGGYNSGWDRQDMLVYKMLWGLYSLQNVFKNKIGLSKPCKNEISYIVQLPLSAIENGLKETEN
jgi:hypothetical protein